MWREEAYLTQVSVQKWNPFRSVYTDFWGCCLQLLCILYISAIAGLILVNGFAKMQQVKWFQTLKWDGWDLIFCDCFVIFVVFKVAFLFVLHVQETMFLIPKKTQMPRARF